MSDIASATSTGGDVSSSSGEATTSESSTEPKEFRGTANSLTPPEPKTTDTKAVDPKVDGDSSDKSESKKPATASKSDDKEDKKEPKESGSETKSEETKEEPPKKHKVKINGKEVEMTEAELIRRASLSSGAEEKFQEAAQMRQQVQQVIEMLKNPKQFFEIAQKLGHDVTGMSEEHLSEQVRREMMSPEECELEDLRNWKAEQERIAQEQAEAEQRTAAEQQEYEARQQAAQFYDQKITEILSQADLPKTPYTVKKVAARLKAALAKGYEMPVETAVDLVRQEFSDDIQSMYGSLEGEALVNALGADLVKKIRAHDLQQLKARRQATHADVVDQKIEQQTKPTPRESEGPQNLDITDWRERIRRKAGL